MNVRFFTPRLIRDADKLDNCRVKLVDDLETFMGASAEEIGENGDISVGKRRSAGRTQYPLFGPGDADGLLGVIPGLFL